LIRKWLKAKQKHNQYGINKNKNTYNLKIDDCKYDGEVYSIHYAILFVSDLRPGPPRELLGPRAKRKLDTPLPILQIMILKLSPLRCVISKESVQQK
jgi:hypothetical protein